MNPENRLLVTVENFPNEESHNQQEYAKSVVKLDENEMMRVSSAQECVLSIFATEGLEEWWRRIEDAQSMRTQPTHLTSKRDGIEFNLPGILTIRYTSK